jgi:CheY-like chemotaxis protein
MAAPPPLRIPDLHGLTILVVEDNDDAMEVLDVFLKACGAHILLARSGVGALAYVDTTPKLDVVVTDVAMPHMDGVTFAQKVRSHPSRKNLPVIALTGFPEQYLNAQGFDAFLRKPVDLDQLGAVIRSVTGWDTRQARATG